MFAILISLTFSSFVLHHGALAESVKPDEAKQLRDEVRFLHRSGFRIWSSIGLSVIPKLSIRACGTLDLWML